VYGVKKAYVNCYTRSHPFTPESGVVQLGVAICLQNWDEASRVAFNKTSDNKPYNTENS